MRQHHVRFHGAICWLLVVLHLVTFGKASRRSANVATVSSSKRELQELWLDSADNLRQIFDRFDTDRSGLITGNQVNSRQISTRQHPDPKSQHKPVTMHTDSEMGKMVDYLNWRVSSIPGSDDINRANKFDDLDTMVYTPVSFKGQIWEALMEHVDGDKDGALSLSELLGVGETVSALLHESLGIPLDEVLPDPDWASELVSNGGVPGQEMAIKAAAHLWQLDYMSGDLMTGQTCGKIHLLLAEFQETLLGGGGAHARKLNALLESFKRTAKKLASTSTWTAHLDETTAQVHGTTAAWLNLLLTESKKYSDGDVQILLAKCVLAGDCIGDNLKDVDGDAVLAAVARHTFFQHAVRSAAQQWSLKGEQPGGALELPWYKPAGTLSKAALGALLVGMSLTCQPKTMVTTNPSRSPCGDEAVSWFEKASKLGIEEATAYVTLQLSRRYGRGRLSEDSLMVFCPHGKGHPQAGREEDALKAREFALELRQSADASVKADAQGMLKFLSSVEAMIAQVIFVTKQLSDGGKHLMAARLKNTSLGEAFLSAEEVELLTSGVYTGSTSGSSGPRRAWYSSISFLDIVVVAVICAAVIVWKRQAAPSNKSLAASATRKRAQRNHTKKRQAKQGQHREEHARNEQVVTTLASRTNADAEVPKVLRRSAITTTRRKKGKKGKKHDHEAQVANQNSAHPDRKCVDEAQKVWFSQSDELLGRGSNGVVVRRGFDSRTRHNVAIKCIPMHTTVLADKEEAAFLQLPAHPNVIAFKGKFMDPDHVYLILELCDANLDKHVADLRSAVDTGRLSKDQVTRRQIGIMRDIVNGMHHIHTAGQELHGERCSHNDVHPGNIFLLRDRAKIGDFGLAKFTSSAQSSTQWLTSRPQLAGWVAPEVVAGGRLSSKLDIFSLGIMLHFIATLGKHPFSDKQGDGGAEDAAFMITLVARGREQSPRMQHLMAGWPLLHDLVSAMIQVNPDDRPTMEFVKDHVAFKDAAARYAVLVEVISRVDHGAALERMLPHVASGGDWKAQLPSDVAGVIFGSSASEHTTYMKGNKVRHLLKLIRNTVVHLNDQTEEMWQLLLRGASGSGGRPRSESIEAQKLVLALFEPLFPKLPLVLDAVLRNQRSTSR